MNQRVFSLGVATLALIFAVAVVAAGQQPRVNISYPLDETLLRANVPVFGTAFVPGDPNGLKEWVLEYGPGRNPQEWRRVANGTTALNHDPYLAGEVYFSANKEPEGNLGNWATGLGSFRYGAWHENLNGIYTLRLRAESRSGEVGEVRRRFYVGEALVRTRGGTAVSADRRCRLVVVPFSYGAFMARVVAIVRQTPPEEIAPRVPGQRMAVDEDVQRSREIYETLGEEYELLSAIYRIYPNSLATDPAALLEIEAEEGSEPLGALYQFNPVARLWAPLETRWAGGMAVALLPEVAEYEAYVALLRRRHPPIEPRLHWVPSSALSGEWRGSTEPHATIEALFREESVARTVADRDGVFSLPMQLAPGRQRYGILIRPRGSDHDLAFDRMEEGGELLQAGAVQLSMAGDPTVTPVRAPVFSAQVEGLAVADGNLEGRRSLGAGIRVSGRGERRFVEMVEMVPGSGRFLADLEKRDGGAGGSAADWVRQFAHGTEFVFETGTSVVEFGVADETAPRILLGSRTHPSLVYANAQWGELRSSRAHSQSRVQAQSDSWLIGGVRDPRIEGGAGAGTQEVVEVTASAMGPPASARVTYWPVERFSAEAWPLIGFTYRLQEPSPWQLMLRSGERLRAFTFGLEESWFTPFASSQELIADGQWHYWQQNLAGGPLPEIDSIAFGSWLETAYWRADPAFTNPSRHLLQIRDIWVGRAYEDPNVEMSWRIETVTPLRQLRWWVDQSPVGDAGQAAGQGVEIFEVDTPAAEGVCRFKVASAGRWFFHLETVDLAGNRAGPVSYPLFIRASRSAPMVVDAVAARETRRVRWRIPDDEFRVEIRGYGDMLDANQFAVEVHGRQYRLDQGAWDRGAEILTIGGNRFQEDAPLLFDGEVVEARIVGQDLQGRPAEGLPMLEITAESAFLAHPRDEGGWRLQIDGGNRPGLRWGTFWERDTPPWLEHFPGAVNNVLCVGEFPARITRRDLRRGVDDLNVKWARPIVEAGEKERWLEFCSWDRAGGSEAVAAEQTQAATLNRSGAELETGIRPVRGSPASRENWVLLRHPADPFEKGSVFLSRRSESGMLRHQAAPLRQVEELIGQHPHDEWRVEAWLPPRHGYLRVGTSRGWRAEVVRGADGLPRELREPRIEAGEEWTRVVLFLTAQGSVRHGNPPNLSGNVFW